MTFKPVCRAHPTALSRYGAAPKVYVPAASKYAQYPIGILTTLNPAFLIFWKSASETKESQWGFSAFRQPVLPNFWHRVHSSTTVKSGVLYLLKMEGVMKGSTTSHPPMLTPRTFVVPQLYATRLG